MKKFFLLLLLSATTTFGMNRLWPLKHSNHKLLDEDWCEVNTSASHRNYRLLWRLAIQHVLLERKNEQLINLKTAYTELSEENKKMNNTLAAHQEDIIDYRSRLKHLRKKLKKARAAGKLSTNS